MWKSSEAKKYGKSTMEIQIKWKITQELPNTIRGTGGFGSTGKK